MLAVAVLALAGVRRRRRGGRRATTGADETGEAAEQPKDKVTLQLKWVTQAQFAGYYAALEQGYYDDEDLDVEIKVGGPDITPEQVVASGQAEFGINWLPSPARDARPGRRPRQHRPGLRALGMTEVTWKDSGITDVAGMEGKKVGVWCCGNEFELFAALTKNGIDPKDKSDVTIVNQPFDMNLFLNRQVDAAAAMTYNELAQVLEHGEPGHGRALHARRPQRDQRWRMPARRCSRTASSSAATGSPRRATRTSPTRFLKASLQGWIYCRDNPEECLQIVLDNGPTLGEGHQRWQLNEINALIWPNEGGIGVMDEEDFQRTAEIAEQFGVIKQAPSRGRVHDRRTPRRRSTASRRRARREGRELGEGRPWR